MTDERIPETALLKAVRRLPRGAGVVLRHRSWTDARRYALFRQIRATRGRALIILIAGTARDAARWGADGWHDGSHAPPHAMAGQPIRPRLIHSASAHDLRELRGAARAGADMLFLSPLWPTQSHAGAPALGSCRFAALARQAHAPVMALGGVHRRHAGLVIRLGASGYGAIDGLVRI